MQARSNFFRYLACTTLVGLSACTQTPLSSESTAQQLGPAGDSSDSSIIAIDGSSTVFPITEAVAEEYRAKSTSRVTIGISGTGGGFKKFCSGETQISNASRPIKPTEVELCRKAHIEYIELAIAYDGIAIVVHKSNSWADQLTVAEIKKMWAPEAQDKIQRWNQIRKGWPDKEMHLFGPGVDSGTYDYFTKAIVGTEHASRGDFTSSEDDNVLVQGIATDKLALGFFGFAYYAENRDRLKVVPVDDGKADNGAGAIAPSVATVADGTYQPLSRPIFIYVSKAASLRVEVRDFVNFYLDKAAALVAEVGYIPLPAKAYARAKARFDSGTSGSLYAGQGSRVGVSIQNLPSH